MFQYLVGKNNIDRILSQGDFTIRTKHDIGQVVAIQV